MVTQLAQDSANIQGVKKVMTIPAPGLNEMFRITILKSLLANPGEVWANTYEVRAEGAQTNSVMLRACGDKLVSWEKEMHLNTVQFNRMVMSTWIAEEGYEPSGFVSVDLDGVGERAVQGEALPLEVVLKVRREVAYGRYGNVFLRGVLCEGDVSAPSGVYKITNAATWDNEVTSVTAEHLSDYIGEGATASYHLVMAGKNQQGMVHTREIVSLKNGGVGLAKVSRRYFNRGG